MLDPPNSVLGGSGDENSHAVDLQALVSRNQGEAARLRLSDQHPVEWVIVMARQRARGESIGQGNWENGESIRDNLSLEVVRVSRQE